MIKTFLYIFDKFSILRFGRPANKQQNFVVVFAGNAVLSFLNIWSEWCIFHLLLVVHVGLWSLVLILYRSFRILFSMTLKLLKSQPPKQYKPWSRIIDNMALRVTLTQALMEKNHFRHWCAKNIMFHEKLKRTKLVPLKFQEGLTQFFHERGVLHVKCVE